MTVAFETVGMEGAMCNDEHEPIQLLLKVCHSFAGYYLGYQCPQCGPYSRESGYFKTEEEATEALNDPEAHDRIFDEIP